MTSGIATLLNALADIAVENNKLLPSELQPGLPRSKLEQLLAANNFSGVPPDAWFQAYQWRNGTPDSGSDSPLFYYHRFAPVEEALAERRSLERLLDESPNPPPLLPLFTFMGEWYAMDCSANPALHGRILFLFQGDNVAYDSLEAMLESILDCYAQGAYRFDQDGETVVDEQLAAQIKLGRNRCRAVEPYMADAAHP
jgi:hypothetical protein